jgi:predicted GNAT family acetyltransferase
MAEQGTDAIGPIEVVDNVAAERYEAHVAGEMGIATYRRQGDSIVFTHTEVPPAIAGHGVADALVHTALDAARAQGLRVVPACHFVDAFMQRHPEYDDLRKGSPAGR